MRPPSATGDFFYFEHFYDYRKYDKKIIYNYNDLNLTTSVDGPCLEKIFFSAVEKIAKENIIILSEKTDLDIKKALHKPIIKKICSSSASRISTWFNLFLERLKNNQNVNQTNEYFLRLEKQVNSIKSTRKTCLWFYIFLKTAEHQRTESFWKIVTEQLNHNEHHFFTMFQFDESLKEKISNEVEKIKQRLATTTLFLKKILPKRALIKLDFANVTSTKDRDIIFRSLFTEKNLLLRSINIFNNPFEPVNQRDVRPEFIEQVIAPIKKINDEINGNLISFDECPLSKSIQQYLITENQEMFLFKNPSFRFLSALTFETFSLGYVPFRTEFSGLHSLLIGDNPKTLFISELDKEEYRTKIKIKKYEDKVVVYQYKRCYIKTSDQQKPIGSYTMRCTLSTPIKRKEFLACWSLDFHIIELAFNKTASFDQKVKIREILKKGCNLNSK